jgi:hypothetical protein
MMACASQAANPRPSTKDVRKPRKGPLHPSPPSANTAQLDTTVPTYSMLAAIRNTANFRLLRPLVPDHLRDEGNKL